MNHVTKNGQINVPEYQASVLTTFFFTSALGFYIFISILNLIILCFLKYWFARMSSKKKVI